MSYYDYHKFVHLVPEGYTIPKDVGVRGIYTTQRPVETFFTPLHEIPVESDDEAKYYLDYDITRPKLPEEINSVIYNARVGKNVFPVAVYQGDTLWSGFTDLGGCRAIYSSDIESFDTTPPEEVAP